MARVRIAVVEDELYFRDAIQRTLEEAGFACLAGEDGRDALALARDPGVGVMILGLRLAGEASVDVVRELRDAHPALRVLPLIGSVDQGLAIDALRLGTCDYLAKPLHDEELVLAVHRAAEAFAVARDRERLRRGLAGLAETAEGLGHAVDQVAVEEREAYVAQAATDAAATLLDADKTSVMLRVEDSDELRVVAAAGRELELREMDPVVVGRDVAGIAVERAEAVLVESREADPRPREAVVPGRYATDSFAVVPLVSGARCFGVLCATDRRSREAFDGSDLSLLRLLADRVAALLAAGREMKGSPPLAAAVDAPSERPSEDAGRDAQLLAGICDALVQHVEPERVVRAVLEPIARCLNAAPVALHLLDGATGMLSCEGQIDGGLRADRDVLPSARGLTGTVLQSGHLIATETPELDPRYDPDVDSPADGQPGPLLCVPIRIRGKVVGLCRVFLPEGEPASAATGEALSVALSAAVRNVLLYRSLIESIEEVAEARRDARRA